LFIQSTYTSLLHLKLDLQYHFRTVALEVTEVQMLQITPYVGLIVTDRGVRCNTHNSVLF